MKQQIEGNEIVNKSGDDLANEVLNPIEQEQDKLKDETKITEIKFMKSSRTVQRTMKEKKESSICKVCLGDESTKENPLIYPCKCSGTMKFIHLDCLKQWFKQKVVSKTMDYTSVYSVKILECDLCKGKISGKYWLYNKILH